MSLPFWPLTVELVLSLNQGTWADIAQMDGRFCFEKAKFCCFFLLTSCQNIKDHLLTKTFMGNFFSKNVFV